MIWNKKNSYLYTINTQSENKILNFEGGFFFLIDKKFQSYLKKSWIWKKQRKINFLCPFSTNKFWFINYWSRLIWLSSLIREIQSFTVASFH